jgi:hypothetical protein
MYRWVTADESDADADWIAMWADRWRAGLMGLVSVDMTFLNANLVPFQKPLCSVSLFRSVQWVNHPGGLTLDYLPPIPMTLPPVCANPPAEVRPPLD